MPAGGFRIGVVAAVDPGRRFGAGSAPPARPCRSAPRLPVAPRSRGAGPRTTRRPSRRHRSASRRRDRACGAAGRTSPACRRPTRTDRRRRERAPPSSPPATQPRGSARPRRGCRDRGASQPCPWAGQRRPSVRRPPRTAGYGTTGRRRGRLPRTGRRAHRDRRGAAQRPAVAEPAGSLPSSAIRPRRWRRSPRRPRPARRRCGRCARRDRRSSGPVGRSSGISICRNATSRSSTGESTGAAANIISIRPAAGITALPLTA